MGNEYVVKGILGMLKMKTLLTALSQIYIVVALSLLNQKLGPLKHFISLRIGWLLLESAAKMREALKESACAQRGKVNND